MKRHFVWGLIALILSGLFGTSNISFAQTGEWTKKTDMPTHREAFVAGVVNGKIYAIGGSGHGGVVATVEEYDPVTNRWAEKADMPTKRTFLSVCVVNGEIYALGGLIDLADVPKGKWREQFLSIMEAYLPLSNEWTKRADMLTRRVSFSTSVVNDRIYVIGGLNNGDGGNGIFTVEEYDPATDTWAIKANMPTKRLFFSTSVVNDKIYVIGGWVNSAYLPTVEVYDPVINRWKKKADMPTARGFLSTSVVDGKIYAIGGASNLRDTIPTVEVYDTSQDTWTDAPDMPTARRGLSTAVVKGRIYAIGGMVGMRAEGISTVEVFDTGLGVEAKGKLATLWGKLKSEAKVNLR